MKSSAAIAFDYHVSRWLIAAMATLVALALLAIACSALPMPGRWLAGLAVLAWAAFGAWRFITRAPPRVAWQAAGHWRLIDPAGEAHNAQLAHAAVRGAFIVLQIRQDARRIALILGPDNCDADTRRRLRVRLAGSSPP